MRNTVLPPVSTGVYRPKWFRKFASSSSSTPLMACPSKPLPPPFAAFEQGPCHPSRLLCFFGVVCTASVPSPRPVDVHSSLSCALSFFAYSSSSLALGLNFGANMSPAAAIGTVSPFLPFLLLYYDILPDHHTPQGDISGRFRKSPTSKFFAITTISVSPPFSDLSI